MYLDLFDQIIVVSISLLWLVTVIGQYLDGDVLIFFNVESFVYFPKASAADEEERKISALEERPALSCEETSFLPHMRPLPFFVGVNFFVPKL